MSNLRWKEAQREQTSLLAPLERPLLGWLAGRMPRWVVPDQLTMLGLGAMSAAAVFYWLSATNLFWLHLVNLAMLLNWFGDSLDGSLARYRKQTRPRYGFYVDHITDACGTLMLILGLGASSYMRSEIAAGLLISYFMLSINSYLATHVFGTFQLSFWKFSPTELRVVIVLGNLALLVNPAAEVLGRWRLFDFGGAVAIALMAAVFVASVIENTKRLYRMEPPPPNAECGMRSAE